MKDLSTRLPFNPPEYCVGTGFCYDGWHPTEKFDDNRVCFDLLREKERSASLEWGWAAAPIKLCCRLPGSKEQQVFWFSRDDLQGVENKVRELFVPSPSLLSSVVTKLKSLL